MYDVSSKTSLQSLAKWWNEFRERAPVREDEEEDFCVVVVGNKVDIGGLSGWESESIAMNGNGNGKGQVFGLEHGHEVNGQRSRTGKWKVSEEEALSFVEGLVPRSPLDDTAIDDTKAAGTSQGRKELDASISLASNGHTTSTSQSTHGDERPSSSTSTSPPLTRSQSITITNNTHPHSSSSPRRHSPNSTRGRSHSSVRYSYGTKPSVSSLATRDSIYQTPSSSYFDVYESARSSPIPFPRDSSLSSDGYGSIGRGSVRGTRRFRTGTSVSPSSTSTISSRRLCSC